MTRTHLRPQTPPDAQAIVRTQRRAERRVSALRKTTPSAPIAEEFARTGRHYPPPSVACPMRRADWMLSRIEADVFWPANYLTGKNATYDLVCLMDEEARRDLDMMVFRSPYTAAIDELASRGILLKCLPLASEHEADLKREIAQGGRREEERQRNQPRTADQKENIRETKHGQGR